VVQRGETLTSIGARLGVMPRVLAQLNGLRAEAKLQIGQSIAFDARHLVPAFAGERVLINIPQRLLFLTGGDGRVSAYPVAVGRPSWPTFTGPFTVATLETDPVWDVPVSIQAELRRAGKIVVEHVAPGPDNPLGAYWIGLSQPGYGIHSTNAPSSIYGFVTHGCIRLHPDDARQVFEAVAVGTSGRITYEPLLLGRTTDGAILLEAQPDPYRRQLDPLTAVREQAAGAGLADLIDWVVVSSVIKARDGIPANVGVQ
jgi:L,D-transpeptidase ErfK/SrfK